MKEAKTWQDTVMTGKQIDAIPEDMSSDDSRTVELAVAQAQAEISFKAGMEEESTQAYHAGLADGRLRGIKEAVELWGKRCPECGNYIPKNLDGTRTLHCYHCDWDGQAQLKSWNVSA